MQGCKREIDCVEGGVYLMLYLVASRVVRWHNDSCRMVDGVGWMDGGGYSVYLK